MKRVFSLLLAAVLILSAAGCKASSGVNDSIQPHNTTPSQTTEPELTGIHTAHKSGDRFETIIMLEGMEEPAMAEHFVNPNGVYCIDYFYEDFELVEDSNGESFLWRGFDGGDILGYMCLRVTPGLKAADQARLICLRMNADAQNVTFAGYDALEISGYIGESYVTHYLFDTPRGCVEIEIACIIEGLEGIGARMHAMLATFEMLP